MKDIFPPSKKKDKEQKKD